MTGKAILELVGGIRAAVFLGLLILVAIAAGVQTWRVHSAETREAKLEASLADWRAAQTTNLGTIQVLRVRLASLAAARALEAEKQAEQVLAAQKAAKAAQRAYEARQRQLERLYASDPAAARWGAVPVPDGVLPNLPGDPD